MIKLFNIYACDYKRKKNKNTFLTAKYNFNRIINVNICLSKTLFFSQRSEISMFLNKCSLPLIANIIF